MPVETLARTLGVTAGALLADIDQIGSRLYYFPAAWAEDISVEVVADRIRVRSGGKFARPRRLAPREALALVLALRRLGAEAEPDERDRMLELAGRLDRLLGTVPAGDEARRWSISDADVAGDGIRAVVRGALRDHRICDLSYVASARASVDRRRVHPYVLAERAGVWYVIGYCESRLAVRSFRLDRIVDLVVRDEGFDVPDDFDPADHLRGGRVYSPVSEEEVSVRYSPAVAAWLREQGDVEERGDGGVLVTYNVSDPSWIIREVLGYGADAELLAPDEVRARLVDTLEQIARAHEAEG